ncbi:unnamed protein product [Schistosoma curassoni]|uniref:Uncharacterized protein n=1 Tax=Schistosoma curassoni TaxID=6186 RepID=A0A183JMW4_9TREM|nr:unnamed protein product [Schistosoma curassoni]
MFTLRVSSQYFLLVIMEQCLLMIILGIYYHIFKFQISF